MPTPEAREEELSLIGKEIFKSLFDAHIIVDENYRVRHANDSACTLTGYLFNELIGVPINELIPDVAKDRHQDHMKLYMASPIHRPMGLGIIVKLKRKSGVEIQVEVALSSLKRSNPTERRIIVRIIPKETLIV